jgi:lipopolysaccharide biosynthesis glycosyltransferase
MDIAFNIDDNYIMQCCTTIVSILHNNKKSAVRFHVISNGLTDESMSKIKQMVVNYRQQVFFYVVEPEMMSDYEIFDRQGHISMATYLRLFVSDILPEQLHKIIYMDCDLIVNGSIAELWETDVENYALAAVEDMWSGKADNYVRLGYDSADTYFNAGVLVVNLDYWREHNVSQQAADYVASHAGQLKFNDQDVLNGLFHDCKLLLPFRWNVQDGLLRRKRKIRPEAVQSLDEELKNPVIIHFTGHRKPWDYICLNPYKELFFKYVDMTEWKGFRPITPLSWKLKMAVDSVLYALRLKPRRYRPMS